jgi:alpha-tubulin suppressor-like RCC1 family protein
MVVSGGVGFGRVHACLRGTLWLPEARRATEKKSWFLVTRCGSGIDRDARVLDASDASRSEPLAPGPRRKRAHRTPKLASSTDTFSQTLVKSRRFFPRGATPRRAPRERGGTPVQSGGFHAATAISATRRKSHVHASLSGPRPVWRAREMSFVDLPAHVALTILRRLDARDLCALRATCRAFDAALVETAAFEATRARAPWLAAPRHLDPDEGPPSERRASASAKGEDESWLDVLRFSELAAAARLPRVVAAEDVTAVVDREGRVHVWGPVVDAQGHERDETHREMRRGDGDARETRRETNRAETSAERGSGFLETNSTRCVVVAAGHACSFGAGGERGGLRAFRNVAGVEASPGSGPGNLAGRPPPGPGAPRAPRLAVGGPGRGLGRIVSIAVGRMHALAAAADGSLWSWGNDAAGQLGLGNARASPATLAQFSLGSLDIFSSSPKSRDRARRMRRDRDGAGGSPRAASPGLDGNFADARKFFPGASLSSPGGHHPTQNDDAFSASSSFLSPGREGGHRDAGSDASLMRRVERFSDFGRREVSEKKSVFFVVKVAASRHGSACVTADGALFCWGSNRRGALGLGDDLDRDVPTRVRVCASSGEDDSDDDDFDDETSASGSDFDDDFDERDGGASGRASPGFASSPFASSELAARKFPGALSDTDSTDSDEAIAGVTGREVSRGRGEAKGKAPAEMSPSGARRRDGARKNRREKEKNKTRRDAVVAAFSYGARHAAAVTSRGELFCWGDNRQGQCGRAGGSRGPDAVLWPTRTELPLGSSDDDDDDDDDDGAFRRGNGDARRHPGTTKRTERRRRAFATDAAAGATHTLALDDKGRVWSFGTGHGLAPGDPADGYDETMYDPREGHSRRPPERARFFGVHRLAVAVAAGARHSAVLVEEKKENGEEKTGKTAQRVFHAYTWGANDAGQLGGRDQTFARPTPTRVASFPTSDYVVREGV